MLITDKELLKNYTASKKLWAGIPSIEVTEKGRIFLTFYSGGTKEEVGNYVLLIKSDDGIHFSEPVAVCFEEGYRCYDSDITPKGSFMYITDDKGKIFKKLGFADVENRTFDEHMFLEMNDGVIRTFVRTTYGIGAADSYDGGHHFGKDFDTGYKGPCSRFHIRRLPSGRVLLINHYNYSGRNNLTALLSEDDGKTFKYHLLLDERDNVSYPDAAIDNEGNIHITYDRERGAFCSCFDDDGYAEYLGNSGRTAEDNISIIFDEYNINCSNIHNIEAETLDNLIEIYNINNDLMVLSEIISLVRSAHGESQYSEKNITDKICRYIIDNLECDCNVKDIAQKLHFSSHYIRHIFKKQTGISIKDFKTAQIIKKAKILLKMSDEKITQISIACGFENPSYFTEIFTKEVGISPKVYRNKNNQSF